MKKFICLQDYNDISKGEIAYEYEHDYMCNEYSLSKLSVENNTGIWKEILSDDELINPIHQVIYNDMVSKIHLLNRECAEKLRQRIDLFFPPVREIHST